MKMNPVLAREVKERMRSRRSVLIMESFLVILTIILYLVYRTGEFQLENRGAFGPPTGSSAASLGRLMFEWLMVCLLLFVAFIAPGIAAGGIVGERERRTLHPLQVTLLTPRNIIFGKLGASLAFVTLLVLASAPLFAMSLVLGGVTPWQVLRGVIVIFTVELMLASAATYISARARRTLFATVASYAVSLTLIFGTVVAFGAETLWREYGGEAYRGQSFTIFLNPVIALGDAAGDRGGTGDLPNPLSGIASFVRSEYEGDRVFGLQREVAVPVPAAVIPPPGIGGIPPGINKPDGLIEGVPPGPVLLEDDVFVEFGPGFAQAPRRAGPPLVRMWMVHVAILLALTALSLWRATYRVRAPAARLPKVREAAG